MKLNLLVDSEDTRGGYCNIDVIKIEGKINPNKEYGDIFDLTWKVDNGECEEIIALDAINFVPLQLVEEVIARWCSKVKIGGQIVLGSVDFFEICKSVAYNTLPIEEGQKKLFLGLSMPRRSAMSISQLDTSLRRNGFNIVDRRSNFFHSIVKGIRQ